MAGFHWNYVYALLCRTKSARVDVVVIFAANLVVLLSTPSPAFYYTILLKSMTHKFLQQLLTPPPPQAVHISLANPCKPQRLENLCGATNFMGIKLQRNKLILRQKYKHTYDSKRRATRKQHQKNTENAIEVKSTRKISGKNQKRMGTQ